MGIKIILGSLIILILATATYITLIPDLKMRIDNDKSTFYVLEDSRWKVADNAAVIPWEE